MPVLVFHVITRLDYGGSAQNTILTALGHDRTRFTPVVIVGRAGQWNAQGGNQATEDQCRRLDMAGVRWHLVESLTRAISPIDDVRAFGQLVRLFRKERPVIVHTHTSKAGVLGRLAAWLTGVPVIIHTPHGHVFYSHFGRVASWIFLQIERWLARCTTRLIALTEAERDEHVSRGVGRQEQFAVVPSGIDLDRFHRVASPGQRPKDFACPPEAVVVGAVGWLTAVKGHHVLIEAFARLQASHPQLYLVIIGSGELQSELDALAQRLGIAERVRFLGRRDDVADCLAGMDVFVHPSLNEGMGRAIVEAMAGGLPVVASRVGGIPSLIEHRRTGLLVPPGNASALAEAIEELVNRPVWAKALGTAAREQIGERFGIASMVQGVEAVYREALAAAGFS